MPRVKLTERTIQKLKAPDPTGQQVLHWDDELKGFAVLCSGTTSVRTYVVQRAMPRGKTRRLTVGAVNEISLIEARKRAADMLDSLRRGIDPKKKSAGDATLTATLENYLTSRKTLRPASVRLYRIAVSRWLAPWANLPLRSVTPEMVEERHARIAASIARNNKQKRITGKTSANLSMRVLRALHGFAADRDGAMPPNPVRRLKKAWFEEQRRTRLVAVEQLPAFYQAVCQLDNGIARDLILLLLFTGMRVGEARTLRWEDIDLPGRVIRVRAEHTKGKRQLDLPMSDFVHAMLVARRALGRTDFVFPGRTAGTHIKDLTFAFDRIADTSGVTVSAHDLRRTFLTVAESCDVSPLALKALVNHSIGGDVTAGYVVMTVERLRVPAQTIANRLKELCRVPEVSGANVSKLA